MKRLALWLGVVALLIALSIVMMRLAQSVKKGPSSALAAAIVQARSTLGGFKERVAHPRPDDTGFFVRATFHSGAAAETLWVKEVANAKDGFQGILAETPYKLTGMRKGGRVVVRNDDVVDWTIVREGGSKEGNFTAGLEPR